jgi:glycosyltransferase involved in cell wall biosynthesis
MDRPVDFTVLICTRDRTESLKQTLAALESLQFNGTFEVLVVDNGPTDATRALTDEMNLASATEYRYLPCPVRGKSHALNLGVRAARGECIAFTDDDAIPRRDWLTRLSDTFTQHGADWAYGRVEPRWLSEPPRWFTPELNGLFALLDHGSATFVAKGDTPEFIGVNCAVRRSAILALGEYRVDLGPTSSLGGGGEDSDMFTRALLAGQRVVYDPQVVVEHMIAAERTTRAFHRRRMTAGRLNNYRLAVSAPYAGPKLLGVPRYFWAAALTDLWGWISASVRLDRPKAFMHQISFLRYGGVIQQAVVRSVQRPWSRRDKLDSPRVAMRRGRS